MSKECEIIMNYDDDKNNNNELVKETNDVRSYKAGRYTYGDYLKWSDDERWELIEGQPFDMSPAPSRQHQKILGNLFTMISNYLKDKKCEVYVAPFDIRLPEYEGQKDEEIINVVQPDITIICDLSKLDDKGCKGAPDLVVEVLSPATAGKDLKLKLKLYENQGVKEYWLIHPIDKTVIVFQLNDKGEYGKPETYAELDSITVGILDDLDINLKEVFRN